MKKIVMNVSNKILALLLILFTKGYAFAQTSLGDPSEPSDKRALPRNVLLEISGLVLLLIVVFYAGYRYWKSKNTIKRAAAHGRIN